MPRERKETVLMDDGKFQKVQVELEQRGEKKTAEYDRPTLSYFKEYILNLSDTPAKEGEESDLARAHRLYVTSLDRVARMSVYESLAAESTIITVGKEKVDIMTFPVAKLIRAINGMRSQVDIRDVAGTEESRKAAERAVGYGPWKTAARFLCEGYTKDDGTKVQPQAKENEATGMLEPLPA